MHINEPDFWLVLELDGELKAVDPTHLSTAERDVDLLVGVALGYHEGHPGRRLVFMSDLAQWLSSVGLDWARLDVDLVAALDAIAGEMLSACDLAPRLADLSVRS